MKKAYIKRFTTRLHKRFSSSLKKNDAKILLTVAISFLFCGCANMFSAIYGVRQLDSFNEALCDKFTASVEREGISLSTLVSDSLQFVEYWNLYPDSLWKKTASQPIQLPRKLLRQRRTYIFELEYGQPFRAISAKNRCAIG